MLPFLTSSIAVPNTMRFRLKICKRNESPNSELSVICTHYVIYSCHMIQLWHMQIYCVALTVAFLPVTVLRVPQKKKSNSLEDLQSESLEKVGLFGV